MTEDKMIIPLRVPVELGREWKVEAAKAGKSVQKWLLGRMNFTEPVRGESGGKPVSGQTPLSGDDTPRVQPPSRAKPLPVKETQDVPVGRFYGAEVLDEPLTHRCHICKDNFPQSKMVYHAKTAKWACLGCVDNQKNSQ